MHSRIGKCLVVSCLLQLWVVDEFGSVNYYSQRQLRLEFYLKHFRDMPSKVHMSVRLAFNAFSFELLIMASEKSVP